jgi:hypothetical protein
MNDNEVFLNGIAAGVSVVIAIGMLVHIARTAYRDRQRIADLRAGTAVPALPPGTAEGLPLPVGAPPESYKRMRLLITGCSDGILWYADKIGQEVPYLGTWPIEGCHKSREDFGFVNIVKLQDARIIDREVNTK